MCVWRRTRRRTIVLLVVTWESVWEDSCQYDLMYSDVRCVLYMRNKLFETRMAVVVEVLNCPLGSYSAVCYRLSVNWFRAAFLSAVCLHLSGQRGDSERSNVQHFGCRSGKWIVWADNADMKLQLIRSQLLLLFEPTFHLGGFSVFRHWLQPTIRACRCPRVTFNQSSLF